MAEGRKGFPDHQDDTSGLGRSCHQTALHNSGASCWRHLRFVCLYGFVCLGDEPCIQGQWRTSSAQTQGRGESSIHSFCVIVEVGVGEEDTQRRRSSYTYIYIHIPDVHVSYVWLVWLFGGFGVFQCFPLKHSVSSSFLRRRRRRRRRRFPAFLRAASRAPSSARAKLVFVSV